MSAEDYVEVVQALNDADGIAAYELNVSCPNTKHGGLAFGVDEAALADLVARVKKRGEAAGYRQAVPECDGDRAIRPGG